MMSTDLATMPHTVPRGSVWIHWRHDYARHRAGDAGPGTRAHRPSECRRLGAGRPGPDRRTGGCRSRGRAVRARAGRDQGQLLLAFPLSRRLVAGRTRALGAVRAGHGVRPAARTPAGSARTTGSAVPDGGACIPVACRLQRAAQGAGPSGGQTGDRTGLQAAAGLPYRFVPAGRAWPRGCGASCAPDLRGVRRFPAAEPAVAAGADAAGRIRSLRGPPHQDAGTGLTAARRSRQTASSDRSHMTTLAIRMESLPSHFARGTTAGDITFASIHFALA